MERRLFVAATLVALLHALDDAFFHRQPGVDAGQHVLAAAVAVAGAALAIAAYHRLRPGLRAAVALTLGAFATTNGALHLIHVTDGGAAASDVTGVLALVAGAVLLGLGLAVPLLRRRERPKSRRRAWAERAAATALAAAGLFVFLAPVSVAIVQTHKYREPIGAAPAGYREVDFRASDGLRLEGWYRPSRTGAAVVVVHGGSGDRTGSLRHARLLARHGFGVLVYDSRGRGESEGSHNAFGWGWEKDVAGALDFLQRRPDVDPARIGGLGLSTGADVLIEVAASDRRLKAVVSDGATGRSFADLREASGLTDPSAPLMWTMLTATKLFSGTEPGRPLIDLVAEVSPTPLLLVAAGKGVAAERTFNDAYAEAAREPFEHWDLPGVSHTNAISERPREYERRVLATFAALR